MNIRPVCMPLPGVSFSLNIEILFMNSYCKSYFSYVIPLGILVMQLLLCSADNPKILPVSTMHSGAFKLVSTLPHLLLAEQRENRIMIVDIVRHRVIWQWKPEMGGIRAGDLKWFKNLSDMKPVYQEKYLLITASGGGVALIRVADKRVVFYAYAGGNVHSAEVLPDGNIVSASSEGNFLEIFQTRMPRYPDSVRVIKIPVTFAHNVVWDQLGHLLWTASLNYLYAMRYNGNRLHPNLMKVDSIRLPGTQAHDLFPEYGKNALWISNTSAVYEFDLSQKRLTQTAFSRKNVKSVSSGPQGTPIALVIPTDQWWTDQVLSDNQKIIFQQKECRIYKARWLLPNVFSYGPTGTEYPQFNDQ